MILYVIAGIVCVSVALALIPLWQFRRVVALSDPTEPFTVGRVSYDWLDTSRQEIFSADPNAKREMVVWIWYPAAALKNSKPASHAGPKPEPEPRRLASAAVVEAERQLEAVSSPAESTAPPSSTPTNGRGN